MTAASYISDHNLPLSLDSTQEITDVNWLVNPDTKTMDYFKIDEFDTGKSMTHFIEGEKNCSVPETSLN